MQRLFATLILCMAFMGICRSETLLVTSDLHLTGDVQAHAPALSALISAAEGCDGFLALGDNTNNAHAEEHAYMLDFLASMTDSGVPAWVIPGNHDLTLELRPSDFARQYGAYGPDIAFSRDTASASCAVMTPGGTCLLLLDTNAYSGYNTVAPLGGISEETIAWVEEALSEIPPGTPTIACGHHPILPPENRDRTTNAGRLAEALRNGGVRLYLCGHDHGFAAVCMDGLQQITVGQPQAYPGWAGLVTIEPAGIHWQVKDLYARDDLTWRKMASASRTLAINMGRSTLAGTPYEGNDDAAMWFADCFDLLQNSELTEEKCAELLATPEAQIWREIEPKTVVKRWIFSVLENCPQDFRDIWILLQ